MKKTASGWLIFTFIVLSPLFSDQKNGLQIQSLNGTVEVTQADGTTKTPAQTGMMIARSDTISTGPKSFCVVKMDESNSFRIKQNTTVKVDKIWEEVNKSDGKVVSIFRMDVMRGELTAKLNKLPKDSEFSVSSPVAVAGASGTAYTVAVSEETHRTSVTVLDHTVRVESINEPQKTVQIQQFQRVDTAPWDKTLIQAIGRGVLSEAILGKKFVTEAEENVQIQADGTGKTEEEAKLQAFHKLSKIILQLRVDPQRTLESVMAKNLSLTQKVFQLVSQAKIVGSLQSPDGSFQVKARIQLLDLNQALGMQLFGIHQSIIPVTLQEYSSKFGALARVTTQRAAQVEGYRNLAELIYGTVINSTTTIEDFAVKDDTIRTMIQGVVKGAQVVNTQYFSDGSVIVSLEIRGDLVPDQLKSKVGDVFGQNYLSGPVLLEFSDFNEYLEMESGIDH